MADSLRIPKWELYSYKPYLFKPRKYLAQLLAPNGEPLLVTEPYNSRQARAEGIEAIKRYANEAIVTDRNSAQP